METESGLYTCLEHFFLIPFCAHVLPEFEASTSQKGTEEFHIQASKKTA